ncbi:MAG TPA: replicative DNA helicase [Thermoanaerobaculia bacterium]|jgi:replicative DNA helicase|nr:replicative DNA helicase [Thermoanaerobaculia bacterium]
MTVAQLDVTLDRPMPQSPDAERAVLGSILINNHAFYRVIGIIDTGDFFKDAHRTIFATMRRMAEESREIEPLTLKEEMAKHAQLDQVGGVAYISSLLDMVPDVANVERYAKIVKEKSTLRRLIIMGNSVMRAALDAPSEPGDVLTIAEKSLYEIAEGTTDKGFVTLGAITRTNMGAIEQMHSNAGRLVTGLPTGYDRFNEMTSGFQAQDLIILAARPSMGKTSLMMNIAESIALPGKDGQPRNGGDRLYGVGVFSLEMSKEQIGLRLLSSESGVSNHLIRSGMLSERNWRELAEAASRLAKGKIYIDDTPGVDPLEMRAKARRLKMEVGIDMIMVDYLQLMSVKGKVESRQQEISQISRGLKAIAKELNVPLLSLSQLSRRPEQRTGDHRPQLSDLRESGSIEQDADLVCFIYRDEVYNKDTEEKGIAEIIIAKQRNGPIGDFKLVFRNDITKFFNYEPQPEYLPQG